MGNGPFFPRFIKEKALKNVPLCTSSEVETTNLRFFERNLANRGRRTLSPPFLYLKNVGFFLFPASVYFFLAKSQLRFPPVPQRDRGDEKARLRGGTGRVSVPLNLKRFRINDRFCAGRGAGSGRPGWYCSSFPDGRRPCAALRGVPEERRCVRRGVPDG